jgi:hypothetical protein
MRDKTRLLRVGTNVRHWVKTTAQSCRAIPFEVVPFVYTVLSYSASACSSNRKLLKTEKPKASSKAGLQVFKGGEIHF